MQTIVRSARLKLPSQLNGGDVPGMFARYGLMAVHDTGDTWYVHAAPDRALVTVLDLAGPHMSPKFGVLPSVIGNVPAAPPPDAAGQAFVQRLRTEAASTDKLAPKLHDFRNELALADPSRCGELAERHYGFLRGYENPADGAPLFPHCSAHVVTAQEILVQRMKVPSILMRIDQDPKAVNEFRDGTAQVPASGLYFGASAMQAQWLSMGGYFLGPLLGCLMPRMWAYPCPRARTTVIYGFGRTNSAVGETGKQLLEMLPRIGPSTNPAEPVFAPEAAPQAITWWTTQLNELFRYLTDPAIYVDSRGDYVAYEHQNWMLTIDQVLRLTTSILAEVHDLSAQRTMALWLLGSFHDRLFDKLGKRLTLKKLCRIDYAREQLKIVKDAMPEAAAQILLSPAQRAVDALMKLQDGFYIAEQRRDKTIVIQLSDGTEKELSKQDAAALLLVVHRNGTHGYGYPPNLENLEDATEEEKDSFEVKERLLAHHTGDIPGDIALLPYLYLLVMLSHPDKIRDGIIGRVAKR